MKTRNYDEIYENEMIKNLKCSHGSEFADVILQYTMPSCMGNKILDFRNFGLGLKWLNENSLI